MEIDAGHNPLIINLIILQNPTIDIDLQTDLMDIDTFLSDGKAKSNEKII